MKHVMNKPNKLLSLALALGMSTALLAGCGQQSAQNAQSDSASTSSAVVCCPRFVLFTIPVNGSPHAASISRSTAAASSAVRVSGRAAFATSSIA